MVVVPLILGSRVAKALWHRFPTRNLVWQVSVHRPSRWVCAVPVTHRVQSEPRVQGEEKPKCSVLWGLFCAWRSSRFCSLCVHALVKGAEWRKVPLGVHQLCVQEGGFNTLVSSQTPVAASVPTAPPCSTLGTVLLLAQGLHPHLCISHLLPWHQDSRNTTAMESMSVLCSHLMGKAAAGPAGEWVPGETSSELQSQQ